MPSPGTDPDPCVRRASPGLRSLWYCEQGNIALIFALLAPAVILIAVGSIDLYNIQSKREKLQDVADSAALSGANALGLAVSDSTVIRRTEAFLAAQISEWRNGPTIRTEVSIVTDDSQRAIQVVLNGHSPSFFGSMLPRGGWKYKARSKAQSVGITPLCVIVSSTGGSKRLNIRDTGRLSAPQCLVHSNRDIIVEGGSLSAGQVQAVTQARGVISPVAGTGAERIRDPFAGLALTSPSGCAGAPKRLLLSTGRHHLAPGVHCGMINVSGSARLFLEPGEHWFYMGQLNVIDNAHLEGQDVSLIFGRQSGFQFRGSATVQLEGRRSGTYAGMVLLAVRGNRNDFIITSDNVRSLLGVIYIPDARLVVEGSGGDVARYSDWTVLVASALQLNGSPSLFINANYQGSSVPVPAGVGPRNGGSRLVD